MKSEREDFVGSRKFNSNFNCEPVEQNIRIQDYKPAAVSGRLRGLESADSIVMRIDGKRRRDHTNRNM